MGHVPEGVTVCNARGVFDVPLREWVVGAILAMERGLILARDAQATHAWTSLEPRELAGRRVVILGHGSIGTAIADRLRPFGVEIVGIARTARDGVLGMEDLDGVLPTAEILVDLLPLTSETLGLLDAPSARAPAGWGARRQRGSRPDHRHGALVRELEGGRLRAALDVTDPEPLPPGHPLWALPNALITPHIAGDSPAAATARQYALAGDQVRRLAAGEPLINQVARYLLEPIGSLAESGVQRRPQRAMPHGSAPRREAARRHRRGTALRAAGRRWSTHLAAHQRVRRRARSITSVAILRTAVRRLDDGQTIDIPPDSTVTSRYPHRGRRMGRRRRAVVTLEWTSAELRSASASDGPGERVRSGHPILITDTVDASGRPAAGRRRRR